jgi:hypothetical protein
MMAPDNPRRRVTVLRFLLAMVLLPIGAALAPLGVGIPIFAIGLTLILPDSSKGDSLSEKSRWAKR